MSTTDSTSGQNAEPKKPKKGIIETRDELTGKELTNALPLSWGIGSQYTPVQGLPQPVTCVGAFRGKVNPVEKLHEDNKEGK